MPNRMARFPRTDPPLLHLKGNRMSAIERVIEVNPENLWRLETPGAPSWERTARPGEQPKTGQEQGDWPH